MSGITSWGPYRQLSANQVSPPSLPSQHEQHNIQMKVKLVLSPVSCASRGGVARCPGQQLPVAHSATARSDVPPETFTFGSLTALG